MTDWRKCPVRDNIWVEHIAYLTARPNSRGYSISTNIASLTGCCSAKNANEDFILSAFLIFKSVNFKFNKSFNLKS